MVRCHILGLLVLILLCPSPGVAEGEPDEAKAAGVVVESVIPHSAGEAAGLQAGDLILSWSCAASSPAFPQPANGEIRSPYDLLPLEIEESPRRAVTLRGKRGKEERVWSLGRSEWGIEARPSLTAGLAAFYSEGKTKLEAGDLAGMERSWRSAADSARAAGDHRLAAWFLDRAARALAEAGRWPAADAAYEEALAVLEREADPPAAAELLRDWGETLLRRSIWDAAVERYQRALGIDRRTGRMSLAAARSLDLLGVAAARRSDYAAAEDLLQQALAIREELAPGTTEVARSLNKLGILARLRGDLAAAEERLTQGEEIRRRLSPNDTDHGLLVLNLGNVAHDRGDLEKAESLLRQAYAILEKINPEGCAGCLENLAGIAIQRGNLATADDLLRHVLVLRERKSPDEWETWRILVQLGDLALRRSDIDGAKDHYRRALALAERLLPEGREVALGLRNLGQVALLQGDFASARRSLRRAQEIDEKLAPGSLEFTDGLTGLARLEMVSGGDLSTAERLFRQALAIFKKKSPESLVTSEILRELGEIAVKRGRLQEALSLHRRALDLQSRLAPETTEEAAALYLLGRTERRAGRPQEGIRYLCRAIDILDRQRTRIGGTPEARTSFEATLGDYYQACLEGLIELGRPAEAFHVLERGRARSFLALLAERDLRLSDLPPQLAAERRRLNAEYDSVQEALAPLSAGRDDAEIERLTGQLRELRTRQQEIAARIRRESPRSAALEEPEPLDLAGARAALDPGTVLLEYAVGQERTWLFVVQSADAGGPGLSVLPVALGAKKLRDEVESFRLLLKDPGADGADLKAQARRLYDRLVRPAEPRLGGAQRILFSADGPLHTLAFAALNREDRYLIEWKPVHTVLSATVYAELTRARLPRRDPGGERLVAFGDPVYRSPTPDAPDPEVREAVRRGLALQPLPLSGQEVKSIAGLYPESRVYLGRDATEERAKSIGRDSQLVHFACHGLLDERFPLNSSLALTLPEQKSAGQDNGLLQAWEIFESVRLNADLVTLSACDTALGREMAGEGLVGLTRAFQYAGARSVLATLWGISDRSTARFMERFYGYLRSGKPKDQALQAAQIDQIREKAGLSHPFHWAAFQLTGDWR
jgi:CHAT domain-containing protein/Tfp pilus assembly protein PilF